MNCKYCGEANVIKHGTRKTKKGPVQIYLCKDCRRVFSNNIIPYMNTREELVLRGISFYNLGYSLGETSNMLERSFGERIPRNTLHYWTKNYSDLFTYLKIRKRTERKLPVLPKVYGDLKFSLHRNKIKRLPVELDTLMSYILTAYKGLPKGFLEGKPMESILTDTAPKLRKKSEFQEGTPESRILRMAINAEENDPARLVMINDSYTICRNLPLHADDMYGVIELLQFREGKVRILSINDRDVDDPDTTRRIIACGIGLNRAADVPLEQIEVGVFDRERMWIADMPLPPKLIRRTPKTN